jgi:hypothetical protein
MGYTSHAFERINNRLVETGLTLAQIRMLELLAGIMAHNSTVNSEAIRLCELSQQVNINTSWGNRSNGNEVWAIVRQKDLVTVMLRRATQPKTTEALRVEKVTIL